MKIFIDTEFMEGPQAIRILGRELQRKSSPTIDLISVALVKEDGTCFYAISKEFNLYEAWNRKDGEVYWLRENVLKPIWNKFYSHINTFEKTHFPDMSDFTYSGMKYLLGRFGYDRENLKKGILKFIGSDIPEFYGYFSDFDHVAFAWIFGKMADYPSTYPMYCRDLKQTMDEMLYHQVDKWPGESRLESWLKTVKSHPKYPKQTPEHDALADAKWNKELYTFLQQIQNGSIDPNDRGPGLHGQADARIQ